MKQTESFKQEIRARKVALKKLAKTGAQRNAEYEARMKSAGLVKRCNWIYASDEVALYNHAQLLRKDREIIRKDVEENQFDFFADQIAGPC